MNDKEISRYYKQTLLPLIGADGQELLGKSTVVIAGCGALGTSLANTMVRSGVGNVVIIDRDYIDYDNLPRQILFDEEDIRRGLPKSVAAAEKLRLVNSSVNIVPVVADLTSSNIEELFSGADLILDGTDNFETRFLINEACDKMKIPWVYAGVVSTYGMIYATIPGETPCLNCFINNIPAPGSFPTCATTGVLNTAVSMVTSIEATEGLKILMGRKSAISEKLIYVDVWHNITKNFVIKKSEESLCRICDEHKYELLKGETGVKAVSLCGHNSVQVTPASLIGVPFEDLALRLKKSGEVKFNNYMMKFTIPGYEFTIFPDGRTIIKGAVEESEGKSLYAEYIGY
ncbi:MAG: thiamine biosynthesis protein ThiF [Spirochaetae bacterium HGW-Spirochaetae-5]|nr:MAG: thiamine biosynthesis protein ThiF [Spirochaetae bacterium HGW-Spirochaetae-5]